MDEAIYRDLKSFHEGYLIKLSLTGPGTASFQPIPFSQADPEPGARKLPAAAAARFLALLEERSRSISNPAFVQEEWSRFCAERRNRYMSNLLAHNRILRKLNTRGWLTSLLYHRQSLLGVRNCVCCESHREVIETLFDSDLVPERPGHKKCS
jgi:hypothetical protein